VVNGETYKLALLPSGVLRRSKRAVIGNGVVFDPQAFLDEVAKLQKQGVAISS
jgi:adenylosuccinate synthase